MQLEHCRGGSGVGYERGVRVTSENQTMVIEAAEGQTFTRFKDYTRDGEQPQQEVVNGSFGDDAAAINIELSRK